MNVVHRSSSSGHPNGSSSGGAIGVEILTGGLSLNNDGGHIMIIEIRAAEGGDDAKGLVLEQFTIYVKVSKRRGL